jgi:acyl carrier protein phosphodiesterase
MNYLAHAYLSFGDPDILTGNMISDFVKGKKKYLLPAQIQNGISLHRAIDEYTDHHPVTKKAKEIFRPAYRLYSGAFVDVLYDHFLAIDQQQFDQTGLFDFSQFVYNSLENNLLWLPDLFAAMFPYMKDQNWLYNYREIRGIKKSFAGLARRARYIPESDTATELFQKHYDQFAEYYQEFFPDLKAFAYKQFLTIS